jgi:hypothetical protein
MAKSIHKDDDELNGIVGTFFKAEHANKIQNQVPTGEDMDGSIPFLYGADIGAADAYAVDLVFGKKLSEGTNDTIATNKLKDSTATFITDGVENGHVALNITDRLSAKVTSLDSEGQLSLDADIFTATYKKYAVGPDIFQAPLAYVEGLEIAFKAANANTGASTININSLGTKYIMKYGTLALAAGDIKANQIVVVKYDGINFQLMSVHDQVFHEGNRQNYFPISSNVGGGVNVAVGTGNTIDVQWVEIDVPAGKILKLKRARYNLAASLTAPRLRVFDGTTQKYSSSNEKDDVTLDTTILDNSGGGSTLQCDLRIRVFNSGVAINLYWYAGWQLDLALE